MLRYFISREFFFTLIALVIVGVAGAALLFAMFLPSYTHHGEAIVVPDVYEVSLSNAEKELKKLDLNPVVQDCTYIEDLPALVVVGQRPVALSRVKPDRTIFLTLNQKSPPMVSVPTVVDLSLYHAKSTLESWKLGVGEVSWVPDIAGNVVLRAKLKGENIKVGEKVPQGTKIDLVVGRSINRRRVLIPNLMGFTYDEAVEIIREHSLIVGSVSYNPSGPQEFDGRVFSQSPRPGYGDSIRTGQPVDLFIYGNPPQEMEGVDID